MNQAFQERCILKFPLPNDGSREPRVEIDEFMQDNPMTNLFLVALYNMQRNSLVPILQEDGTKVPNWLNYYGLAGIHGQPREQFNGYGQPEEPNPDGPEVFPGYCHHGLDTFPVWHRPFTALFEMAVYEEMVRVAAEYEDPAERQLYQDAAARFRLPYWDPCMPRSSFVKGSRKDSVFGTPKLLAAKDVFVRLPRSSEEAGALVEIPNPLYRFVYPTEEEYAHPDAKNRERFVIGESFNQTYTTRAPTNGETNDKLLNKAIQLQAVGLATSLWQLLNPDHLVGPGRQVGSRGAKGSDEQIKLNEVRTFSAFANHGVNAQKVGDKIYPTQSVETFHDSVHMIVATGSAAGSPAGTPNEGAMGSTAYAAYDPIFPLLHNNVDRIVAIYQAMFPDKWLNSKQYPLTPFAKNASKECWQPDDNEIKQYWHTGFAIPGTENPKADFATIRTELKKYLVKNYFGTTNNQEPYLEGWPKDSSKSWALTGTMSEPTQAAIERTFFSFEDPRNPVTVVQHAEGETIVSTSSVLESVAQMNVMLPKGALIDLEDEEIPTRQITWNAHVKTRQAAFNKSYTVHLFIGSSAEPSGELLPGKFMTKKNEAGFTPVFTSSTQNREQCANCVRQSEEGDPVITDMIPLTTILYDYLVDASNTYIESGEVRDIADLTPESVVPFLKEHLNWQIIDLGANLIVDGEEQAGLEILVTSREFEAPSPEHIMGVYYPFTPYPEITRGKAGGYRD